MNPSCPRGRTRLRAIAVLFTLALVAALAAVPASARSVTRHAGVTLGLAGPLASAADNGSGDTTDASVVDPSSSDTTDTSGDTTDTSGDTSGDASSGDTTDTSGDPTTDGSGDGTLIDDGSDACGDSTGTSGTTDTSGDTTTDGSGDGTSADDGSDTIDLCGDGNGNGSSTTPTGSARLTALRAAVVKHRGVRVTFRLDHPGRVALTLQAQSAGVAAGKRCVAPSAHRAAHKPGKAPSTAKHGKACTRTTALGGSVPITGTAGTNTTTLTRWRGHKLAAGAYTLTATPRAKGARATTTTFHVTGR
jgi:hypothetical protein